MMMMMMKDSDDDDKDDDDGGDRVMIYRTIYEPPIYQSIPAHQTGKRRRMLS